jgi:CRISPR/Cas system CSM-associated protein Csm3 (group 7 of RAMP superfamily)
MPLLLDSVDGSPLLPGSSIAGALRNHLRQKSASETIPLFGGIDGQTSLESYLIVDDAFGQNEQFELRDGVAIDPKTRTAEDQKKFDIELLTAGTTFKLSFELLVPQDNPGLVEAFAHGLQGLERGDIRLGKRKRRGFGRCRVTEWSVTRYDMTNIHGMIAWLDNQREDTQRGAAIGPLLGVDISLPDTSREFLIEAEFALDGSLLIRSGFGDANAPDFVHLHSKRDGKEQPVLSGTSLAGALRARAMRIANTLGKDGEQITDRIFGNRQYGPEKKELTASRLWVEETEITNALELVQTRLKIDRFTGGTYPGALFNEQPVFGKLKDDTIVVVKLALDDPDDSEIGLLLLLLKDLWTGDLPLGGESSVGRGRLRGKHAKLQYKDQIWELSQREDRLQIQGDGDALEQFVMAFLNAAEVN